MNRSVLNPASNQNASRIASDTSLILRGHHLKKQMVLDGNKVSKSTWMRKKKARKLVAKKWKKFVFVDNKDKEVLERHLGG